MIIRPIGLLSAGEAVDPVTTQFILAASDYSNPDNWSKSTGGNTNLYTMIDDGTPLIAADPADSLDTSDYVESPGSYEGTLTVTFNLTTSGVADPATGSGHRVRLNMRCENGSGRPWGARLLQSGTTEIASWGGGIRNAFQWRNYNLSTSEANSITNYNDLQVEVSQLPLTSTWFQLRIAQIIMDIPV
jgi:hypothetical protein